VAGPVKVDHFMQGSMDIGRFVNRLRSRPVEPARWNAPVTPLAQAAELVQIGAQEDAATRTAESNAASPESD